MRPSLKTTSGSAYRLRRNLLEIACAVAIPLMMILNIGVIVLAMRWAENMHTDLLPFVLGNLIETIALAVPTIAWIQYAGYKKLIKTTERVRRHDDECRIRAYLNQSSRDAISTLDPPDICLYLRPFLIDQAIKSRRREGVEEDQRIHNQKYGVEFRWADFIFLNLAMPRLMLGKVDQVPQAEAFEAHIADMLNPYGLTVALGAPEERGGLATYVADDENWKSYLSRFLDDARLIICIPSTQAGTLFEIREIISRKYLEKTVFAWPAGRSMDQLPIHPEIGWVGAESWRELSQQVPDLPWPIVDSSSGCYFSFRYRDRAKNDDVIIDRVSSWQPDPFGDLRAFAGKTLGFR